MNNNIKALKVKDKWHRDFGVLSYDVANDSFHFKYDSDTTGFSFSDIDIRKGREFTQNKIFNVFSLDDSYSKNNFITELKLENKTDNETQWEIKSIWLIQTKSVVEVSILKDFKVLLKITEFNLCKINLHIGKNNE